MRTLLSIWRPMELRVERLDFHGFSSCFYGIVSFGQHSAHRCSCCGKLLSTTANITSQSNDLMRSKINFLVGPQKPLRATVKRRTLAWFVYVMSHDSRSKTFLQGTLQGGHLSADNTLTGQRQRLDIPAYAGTARQWFPSEKKDSKRISVESSFISPRIPGCITV